MSDLETEMLRQIQELGNEVKTLRERIAILEVQTGQWRNVPVPFPPLPYKITWGSAGTPAGEQA